MKVLSKIWGRNHSLARGIAVRTRHGTLTMHTAKPQEHVKNHIVECNLSSIVVAKRIASQLGEPVSIIDKRTHIGGTTYSAKNVETEVMVHRCGPHVFHINNKQKWTYLRCLTETHPFVYCEQAVVDGPETPVSLNLNSLRVLLSHVMAVRVEGKLIDASSFSTDVLILKLRKTRDADLKLLEDIAYEKVSTGCTIEQWGLTAERESSERGCVSVRWGGDNRYFRGTYQAIPADSYTTIVQRIIEHPFIEVRLSVDFEVFQVNVTYDRSSFSYTGSMDEFFDYKYEQLPCCNLNLVFHSRLTNTQFVPQISYTRAPLRTQQK